MNLDLLIAHPYLAAVLSQFVGAAFVLVAILVLFPGNRKALLDPVIGWARRTFTATGDHPACSCDRFHTEVFCIACRRIRVLTPTSTLSPADAHVLLNAFDEVQRRRDAFEAWEDCDEQAVM